MTSIHNAVLSFTHYTPLPPHISLLFMQHPLQKFPPLHICEAPNSAHPQAFDESMVCREASVQASAVAPDQMSQSVVQKTVGAVTPPPLSCSMGLQEQGYVLHSLSGRVLCRFLKGISDQIAPIL